ncbi:MAG: hypothetical protein JST26_01775 [Bacteroidetes bacterium]|nr:hypothetical protein [Bacteroidota bacterium]
MRPIIFIFLCLVLGSCSSHKTADTAFRPEVRVFSAFSFGSGQNDTISKLQVLHSFQFRSDTLISLGLYSSSKFVVTTYKLSPGQVDSLKALLKQVNFASLKNNTSIAEFIKNPHPYDNPTFGFIDSLGQAEVYLQTGKYTSAFNPSEKLLGFLINMKGVNTNDSSEIMHYTRQITKLYRKEFPEIPAVRQEKVKFVPPDFDGN